MEAVLEELIGTKPPKAQIDIQIHVSATLNITPFVARQKVNVLLLDKVGTGLITEQPTLVAGHEKLCWRVPVVLTLPGRGRVGQVGSVDVDVQTGHLLFTQTQLDDMTHHANQLTARSPLSTE